MTLLQRASGACGYHSTSGKRNSVTAYFQRRRLETEEKSTTDVNDNICAHIQCLTIQYESLQRCYSLQCFLRDKKLSARAKKERLLCALKNLKLKNGKTVSVDGKCCEMPQRRASGHKHEFFRAYLHKFKDEESPECPNRPEIIEDGEQHGIQYIHSQRKSSNTSAGQKGSDLKINATRRKEAVKKTKEHQQKLAPVKYSLTVVLRVKQRQKTVVTMSALPGTLSKNRIVSLMINEPDGIGTTI
ncbi:hypothetical protein EVAR_22060_1 [Eumeta japonica]|uniref:Uncharacterized protein n=1 Tax=Eumeta variegata TaxID=151549 RepID=A0A4C1USM4_EUMVA|nr:hypothetical protein EVAR_22060_1 [Eumeta japonica]